MLFAFRGPASNRLSMIPDGSGGGHDLRTALNIFMISTYNLRPTMKPFLRVFPLLLSVFLAVSLIAQQGESSARASG